MIYPWFKWLIPINTVLITDRCIYNEVPRALHDWLLGEPDVRIYYSMLLSQMLPFYCSINMVSVVKGEGGDKRAGDRVGYIRNRKLVSRVS